MKRADHLSILTCLRRQTDQRLDAADVEIARLTKLNDTLRAELDELKAKLPTTVIVGIEGGLVDILGKPAGVKVTVVDEDICDGDTDIWHYAEERVVEATDELIDRIRAADEAAEEAEYDAGRVSPELAPELANDCSECAGEWDRHESVCGACPHFDACRSA